MLRPRPLLGLLLLRPLAAATECSAGQLRLSNGVKMPAVGLGTAGLTAPATLNTSLAAALAAGYRMFDTADLYSNHHQLATGLAGLLPSFGLTRRDVFLVTKVS